MAVVVGRMVAAQVPQRAGVYRIWHPSALCCYIGSASSLRARFYDHTSSLRRGASRCLVLQRAYNKYGDGWRFQVLVICAPNDRLFYEQRAIDYYTAHGGTYNASKSAIPLDGLRRYHAEGKHSQKGKCRTLESRNLTGESLRAFYRTHPDARERARKQLALMRGLPRRPPGPRSPEQRANYSAAVRRRHANDPTYRIRLTDGLRRIMAQRTTCKNGHLYTPENTRLRRDGSRTCRTCSNLAVARYRAKRGGVAP